MFLAFARWPMLPGLGKAVIRFDDLLEPLAKNTRSTTPIPSSIGTAVTWRTHLTNLDSTSSTCSTPRARSRCSPADQPKRIGSRNGLGKDGGTKPCHRTNRRSLRMPRSVYSKSDGNRREVQRAGSVKILLRSCKTLSPDSSQQNRSTPEKFSNRKGGGRYEVRRLARWSALDACFAVPWRALWMG